MQKFLVMYLIPRAVLDDWKKVDPEQRKGSEEKMMAEWQKWMSDHASMITDTWVGGKTKRVVAGDTSDVRNDITLFSFIEAESHEAATAIFEKHPHLQIPQSSIEVMEMRSMT